MPAMLEALEPRALLAANPTAALAHTFLVNSPGTNEVQQYDAFTGAFIADFVTAGSGGLSGPAGMAYTPLGEFLLVVSQGADHILRYDGDTGAFVDVFIDTAAEGFTNPTFIEFGPDGFLYLLFGGTGTGTDGGAARFNADGQTIDLFYNGGNDPFDIEFGPDGNFYISDSVGTDQVVLQFDAAGNLLDGSFVTVPSSVSEGFAFGPDDNIYISDGTIGGIKRFSGATGAFIDEFIAPGTGGLSVAEDVEFGPDGNLYVADIVSGDVLRFDGGTGAFIDLFVDNVDAGLSGVEFLRFEADPAGPTPQVGDPIFQFQVIYEDDVAIDVSTLNSADMRVLGPGGFDSLANFVSVDVGTDGSPRIATYNVPAPGGTLGPEDNGFYEFVIEPNQVFDTEAIAKSVLSRTVARVNLQLAGGPQLLGPTPYLSAADSPFSGTSFSYFHLEDFTDGLLSTPGVSANQGVVFTTSDFFTDSVDGDDGTVDGSGSQQGSFGVVAGAVTVVFTFDEGVLGSLPTHAGLVWTDGLSNPTRFKAFDASNNLLVDTGNINLPNSGQTQDVTAGEDVFFGVIFEGGIKRIEISETNSIEIDHLQYGLAGLPTVAPTATLDLDVFDLFVSSFSSSQIPRYSAVDGSFIQAIGPTIFSPQGVAFGPDGNFYAVASGSDQVQRFDGQTGTPMGVFANLGFDATGITFGPDGHLYVARQFGPSVIVKFDGLTGANLGTFASDANLSFPFGLTFGPDGNLYVASSANDRVVRFNGTTGAFIDVFVAAGASGIDSPTDLTFGPDGNLYVTGFASDSVHRFNGQTGAFLNAFVPTGVGGLDGAEGLRFGPDGNLYVASNNSDQIMRYDGETGAFIDIFILAGSGGLNGPTFQTFTPLTVNEGATQITIDVVLKDDGSINQSTIDASDFDLRRNGSATSVSGSTVNLNVISPGEIVASVTFNAPSAIGQDVRGPLTVSIDGPIEDDQGNQVAVGTVGVFDLNVLAPETFIVTNTNDSGAGSLRQAITDANAASGPARIVFNILNTDPNFIDVDNGVFGGDAGADAFRIRPLSQLPSLTNPAGIIIDGESQEAFHSPTFDSALGPAIIIDGVSVGSGTGLVVSSNGNQIIGLAITNFSSAGSGIFLGGNDNLVVASHIGVNAAGTAAAGNDRGITVTGSNNQIGLPAAAGFAATIIGGNDFDGVRFTTSGASNNRVQNVQIGINLVGGTIIDLGNGLGAAGVRIDGGNGNLIGGSAGEGNVISFNDTGIFIDDQSFTVVQGNFIGTDLSGGIAAGNLGNGITLLNGANLSQIGGGFAEGNRIAFNGGAGVAVLDVSSDNNQIRGNQIFQNGGLGIDLGGNGVTNNDAGDVDAGPNQEANFPVITVADSTADLIAGSLSSTPGTNFFLDFYRSTAVDPSGFGEGEVHIATLTVITDGSGNAPFSFNFALFPGDIITATATSSADNTSEFSQAVVAAASNVFTVTNTNDSAAGSLRQAIIDANAASGAATIAFNIPNTDPNFTDTDSAIPGGDVGADVYRIRPFSVLPALTNPAGITIDGSSQPTFGGDTNELGPKILIDGNNVLMEGIVLASSNNAIRGLNLQLFTGNFIRIFNQDNNVIAGNYIGTDTSGTLDRGGASSTGVSVFGSNNIVGGSAVADRNIISGLQRGVQKGGAGGSNQILGNFIGTTRTGQTALPNALEGVLISGGVNNIIGNGVGGGNVISGNSGIGIVLLNTGTDGTIIQANKIGVAFDGSTPLGNGADGINVGDCDNTLIGSTDPALGNIIANNASSGIDVLNGNASAVIIRNNQIFNNGNLGIDLGSDGVTANDAGDSDSGANALQNFPVISLVESGAVHIVGTLNSTPNTTFDIDFYLNFAADATGFGEGEIVIDSIQLMTDSLGNAAFDVNFPAGVVPGEFVTATATNVVTGNTSEFSQAVAATVPGLIYLGPAPYLQASDSPFNGTSFGTFFLEDFEDGLLNTPGLTASVGSVFNPGSFEDGVDGDDGAVDGTSLTGHSFGVSSGGVTIDFSFNSTTLGGFPTHAGVVWTDGQGSPVSFEAFDSSGASLGVFGPFTLTISGVQGNTAEDRFFGVEFAGGISKIRIRDLGGAGLEVDHVQYGIEGAANTFIVVNTDDSGTGSLRDAIDLANAATGTSEIVFNIPNTDPNFIDVDSAIAGGDAGADVFVIAPQSPLPNLTNPDSIVINGNSQAFFGGDTSALGPEIVLSGLSAGATSAGIRILSNDNRVFGLNIQGFGGAGVTIEEGDNNKLGENYIGTDATGTLARGNNIGIEIVGATTTANNTIGGDNQGNLISGNTNSGVVILGASVGGNFVFGNLIGTNRLGDAALPNGSAGVEINSGAHDNFIGSGLSNDRNVISGNSGRGVLINASSTGNIVDGNLIGVNAAGTAALGNSSDGIAIFNSSGTEIGGGTMGPGNVISGNLGHGIFLDNADGNVIDNNNIGTLNEGLVGMGNALNGVALTNGSDNNFIGANTPDGGNVIAANGQNGILIQASNGNEVHHNRIGLAEEDGGPGVALPNGLNGILITSGSQNNVVGGPSLDFADVADEFENGSNPTSREDGSTWRFGSATSQAGAITTFTTPFTASSVNGWTFAGGSFGNPPFVARNGTASTQTPSGFVIGAGEFAMHPGASTLAVAEWTSPTDDVYRLQVEFKDGQSGPGATVDVHVLVNGVSVFDGVLSGLGSKIEAPPLLLDLDAGDKVRFVVGNGGNGQGSDPVIVDARIMRASGNLISGNAGSGVLIRGAGTMNNRVQGNFIGVAEDGTTDRGNQDAGVAIDQEATNNVIGGDDAEGLGVGNIISGNGGAGVLIANATTSGNRVQGNFIGTTMFGNAALPNDGGGVVITSFASGNFVGGSSPGAGNIISGNAFSGVEISISAANNRVQGNAIGTDFQGRTDLGNAERGVNIADGASNFIGTDGDGNGDASEGNVISGNSFEGVGIQGTLATNNVVAGNLIGTNKLGTAAIGNAQRGVAIFGGASNNRIGTDGNGTSDANERNVIAGNAFEGIIIDQAGTDGNVVAGNFIGTDISGLIDLGNLVSGVFVSSQAANTLIGGALASQRNVISGNQVHGIHVSGQASATTILGNLIGTNVNGTAAIANSINGVVVNGGATLTIIGDGTVGGRNIISGNTQRGVQIEGVGTDVSSIRGNFIGTNITGAAALGNGENGVLLRDGATNIFVGGSTVGQGNLISGNTLHGVQIANTSAISIEGNLIGTNVSGAAALGNGGSGVLINFAAFNNAVGSGVASGRNIISGNTLMGVQIADAGTNNNVVDGNFIGTNLAGTADLGNGQVGVLVNFGATNNRIGTAGNGNVISGNNLIGIQIADGGTSGNSVKANIIGLNATGNADITDALIGIDINFGASNNTIGGPNTDERNIVSGHELHGVRVSAAASSGNIIQGNFIGTDATGTLARPNVVDGVQIIDATNTTVSDNLISGNNQDGIDIGAAPNTTITGNMIGISANGNGDVGNAAAGVRLVGTNGATIGGAGALRNVISGNNIAGVMLQDGATNNVVIGNFIGTNAAGNVAVGNTFDGVQIFNNASGNTIGGPGAGEGNVISGNFQDGIDINGATGTFNNTVQGNIIGLDATGATAMGNGRGIRIFNSDENVVTDNVISANGADGILVDGGSDLTDITGNLIGTDITGALDRGNFSSGIRLEGATNTSIGGIASTPGTAPGNVISGNGAAGILLKGATTTGTVIRGNIVGTNAAGTSAIANSADGIYVANSPNNTIGGTVAGAGNLISGNIGNGVNIGGSGSTANLVQGNLIGTDITGALAVGNSANGVYVGDDGARAGDPVAGYASGNTIGSASSLGRNVLSGNNTFGYTSNSVGLTGTGNTIIGNFIGTNAAGTSAVPNQLGGMLLHAQNNRVGGANAGEGNVISGNDGDGITLAATFSTGNQIFGNLIGTAANGIDALGNNGNGVVASNFGGLGAAINNTVGGILAGQGNVIAFNQGVGVGIDNNATRISVRGNSIVGNMGIGIDLEIDGVTNNDLDDADTGSNNRQNIPLLAAAVQGSTIVSGSLNARPSTIHQIDFYSNTAAESGLRQGRVFIGSLQVTTNAGGDVDFVATLPITVAEGDFITATATDASGNTSEFSGDVAVAQDTTAPAATLTSAPNVTVAGATTYTFTVTYADESALLNSTIASGNLEVHGPSNFGALATLVSKSTTANAPTIVATYRITAPGGSFNSADTGTYDIILFDNQVTDLAGNTVPGATLGQFSVAIGVPSGAANTPNVDAGGGTTYRFTVTYADADGIDPASLDGGDVIVNGPSGFTTGVTFIGVDRGTRGTPRVATYEFTAPGGFLDAADNGAYQIVVQSDQVSDGRGAFVLPGTVGSFVINIDGSKPVVSQIDIINIRNQLASLTFNVTYADDNAINIATLDNLDIRITGPGGFNRRATLIGVSGSGASVVASYAISPASGPWTSLNNGSYQVTLEANQVEDDSGNPAVSKLLSIFRVKISSQTPT